MEITFYAAVMIFAAVAYTAKKFLEPDAHLTR